MGVDVIARADESNELIVLAADLGDALDTWRATGRGIAKAIRIVQRIQRRTGELARQLEQLS